MTIASTIHGALDTIRAAIPGCVGLQVDRFDTWTAVRIRVDTDEAVRVLAQKLGARIERPCHVGRWWMSATVRDGDVETVIDGPHHEGEPPRVDADALEVALKRARETTIELGEMLGVDVAQIAARIKEGK
ncbi:MAG TPA: hypothetical protein VFO62_10655 [Candidatus Binatia bacterium]|nr:hypothetical protein [Candidatus Binatia bacterium]